MLKGDERRVQAPGKFGRIDQLGKRKSVLCGAAPWDIFLEPTIKCTCYLTIETQGLR